MTTRKSSGTGLLQMAAIAALALLVGASCGGGGGGGGGGVIIIPPGPLVASFTADAGCNGANEVALAPGASVDDTFDVAVRVSGLTDVFGAAMNVTYDPATAVFLGSSSAGSFLLPGGNTLFLAELEGGVAGTVNVLASLQGAVPGVTPGANDLLLTLTFRATAETTGNTFSVVSPREIETCASAGGACTMVPDASVAFCGGSLTASM